MKLVCLYVIVCISLFVGVYGQLCPTHLTGPGMVENMLTNMSNGIEDGQRIAKSLVEGKNAIFILSINIFLLMHTYSPYKMCLH